MNNTLDFFASTPRGIEPFLSQELKSLGAAGIRSARAGVYFQGNLESAYRACLWSRLASRIFMPLATFPAGDADQLYAGARDLPWEDHLALDGTFAVDAVGSTVAIHHSKFAALKVKDAVADRFRELYGKRPSVSVAQPSLRIHLRLHRERATVSLDLSGESLHRRGYRTEGAAAPLKENLAAAILQCAGWPEIFSNGGMLLDPMCGAGTLVIEAALMAADIAPGLIRSYFGFLGWRGHRADLWQDLIAEALERRDRGTDVLPPMVGRDIDRQAIAGAVENARRAGLASIVRFEQGDIDGLQKPGETDQPGLVVANPPYGERLGDQAELLGLYRRLGERLQIEFGGWRGALFIGNPALEGPLGLAANRVHEFYNGAIPCRLLEFRPVPPLHPAGVPAGFEVRGGEMFVNRLRKNLQRLGRWSRRAGVSCYRLYDADVPEFAVAIDLYDRWVHVQEYAPPTKVAPEEAQERLNFVLSVLPDILEVPPGKVFLKVRQRQKGGAQYQPLARLGEFYEVEEGHLKFLVNFTDYLDTGLFLDHRPIRKLVRDLAAGERFLNLYAYTGTATVFAAAGGARESISVDLSKTYLDWAAKNLSLNNIPSDNHHLIHADCREWLDQAASRIGKFELIFLDPPTFSRSKRMEGTLDIQRDHVDLIVAAGRLLTAGGKMIFSNNFRKFRLDEDSLKNAGFAIRDITGKTLDPDFQRQPPIHRCWFIAIDPNRDSSTT